MNLKSIVVLSISILSFFSTKTVHAQYTGEIRMFAGNFAPAGWEFCDGRLLPISENETLFYLIGTTYGGDGQSTFALPDLRGQVPVHHGEGSGLSNVVLGAGWGKEAVTLTMNNTKHTHKINVSSQPGTTSDPTGAVLANTGSFDTEYGTITNATLNSTAVQSAGGNQPVSTRPPSLGINFIISLFGIFPSQN